MHSFHLFLNCFNLYFSHWRLNNLQECDHWFFSVCFSKQCIPSLLVWRSVCHPSLSNPLVMSTSVLSMFYKWLMSQICLSKLLKLILFPRICFFFFAYLSRTLPWTLVENEDLKYFSAVSVLCLDLRRPARRTWFSFLFLLRRLCCSAIFAMLCNHRVTREK